jgi:uncharacterized protein YlxW (UPF0749 family)
MEKQNAEFIVNKILLWFILVPLVAGGLYFGLRHYPESEERAAAKSEAEVADYSARNLALQQSVEAGKEKVAELKREIAEIDRRTAASSPVAGMKSWGAMTQKEKDAYQAKLLAEATKREATQ